MIRKQRTSKPRPQRKQWAPRGHQYGPRGPSKHARAKAQRQAGKAQARAWGAPGVLFIIYLPLASLLA
jgi:hypothetical protein